MNKNFFKSPTKVQNRVDDFMGLINTGIYLHAAYVQVKDISDSKRSNYLSFRCIINHFMTKLILQWSDEGFVFLLLRRHRYSSYKNCQGAGRWKQRRSRNGRLDGSQLRTEQVGFCWYFVQLPDWQIRHKMVVCHCLQSCQWIRQALQHRTLALRLPSG